MTRRTGTGATSVASRWGGAAAALAFAVGGLVTPIHAQTTGELAGAIASSFAAVPSAPRIAEPATIQPLPPQEPAPEPVAEEIGGGMASWYGSRFAGKPTASGERFDPSDYTAAHRSLPFGSLVRVTNSRTGESVVVRINDRGPFAEDRVIDVSRAAASELGLIGPGHAEVTLALLED